MNIYDTIAAIATPPGQGGIGIIRISGDKALEVAKKIFKPMYGAGIDQVRPRTLVYGNIVEDSKTIDEVLLAYMKGPNSYTAEDVVEINCHGGYISLKKILELVLKHGVRLADPGEFTKRAFLNGRIDLSQAEAVMDIIDAKTSSSHEIAQGQLEGGLSNKIRDLRDRVTELLARVEVAIDYPEEDIEHIAYDSLNKETRLIKEDIQKLYDSAETGRVFRDGLKTVIVGKPNVGKSSLLNSILGENRAIVTDIPGTTRDIIEEFINIRGIPLRIVDTAGIRDTEDTVEKIGVERSKESFEQADLVILVLDSSMELSEDDRLIIKDVMSKDKIVIINKIDLERKLDIEEIKKYENEENIIEISAVNNDGIERLYDRIESMVFQGKVKSSSDLVITNSRHKDSLYRSLKAADDAIRALEDGMAFDFIEVDLKNIWEYLGYINGDTVSEDLIDNIFHNFCIGK